MFVHEFKPSNLIVIICRGQMGASPEDIANGEVEKLPNGKGDKKSKKKKHEESKVEVNNEANGGCCQGANGFSCCKDASSDATSNKNLKGSSGLSNWFASLEQKEVLTGVAVVGAVATIAIAYSYYRRSG